jgi:hypothetical protein
LKTEKVRPEMGDKVSCCDDLSLLLVKLGDVLANVLHESGRQKMSWGWIGGDGKRRRR